MPGIASAEGYTALLATNDLAVGKERFAFAVIEPDGSPLIVERLVVHFFVTERGKPVPEGDALAVYEKELAEPPGQQADAQGQIRVRGLFTIPGFNFDRVGDWLITIQPEGTSTPFKQPIRLAFQVAEHSATPAVGELAPDSPTPVGSTPEQLEAICSSDPPDDMHRVSADQALKAGRPFVLAFATPSFCRSRLCGPVTELVQSIEDEFRGKLDFIHVEPYDLEKLRNGGVFELVPAARAWNIPSEPWVFVVAQNGRISAKFEGGFSRKELKRAIDTVVP